MSGNTKEWLRPDEFMKIQQKKLKLQERFLQQSRGSPSKPQTNSCQNGFTSQKRNNPFAKNSDQDHKRTRPELPVASEETMFELIHNTTSSTAANLEAPCQESVKTFPKKIDLEDDEDRLSDTESVPKPTKFLPVDWSIKSNLRILCSTQIVANKILSLEEASGLTGFVRCLDTEPTTTISDIGNGARFQQNLMYWQYPNLPWLNLVQRNSNSNNQFKMNELESECLLKDWMVNFRNLFQLLRVLHCPYFYVLANQFTVLFRAAGIGGRSQMHALLTPTTRGFRKLLKDEDIEFSQPLKASSQPELTPNTSLEKPPGKEDEEEEEEDEMKFLESLGVESSDIKFKDDIKAKLKEVEDDNGELSTVLIEGADCQAFFNFLLNAKSTVPKVGRLAGIPPTLLSPVAFIGGSLCKQTARASKLQNFFSIEIKGAILPHIVHTLCAFLSEIKEKYSLTMKNYPHTVAFAKTSRQLSFDPEGLIDSAGQVMACANLLDCGIVESILQRMCKNDSEAVNIIERLQFDRELGFTLF